MSNEEINYLNTLNAGRRERLCRRECSVRMGIQWGGWLLAGLTMALSLATRVH